MNKDTLASSEDSREARAPSLGPELNALVAERVMGWRKHNWITSDAAALVCKQPTCQVMLSLSHWTIDRAPLFCPGQDPWQNEIGEHIPDFSRDIAHAWRVVEKLRDLGIPGKLSTSVHGYAARFTTRGENFVAASATSLPEAICRAALATLTPKDGRDGSLNTPEGSK